MLEPKLLSVVFVAGMAIGALGLACAIALYLDMEATASKPEGKAT